MTRRRGLLLALVGTVVLATTVAVAVVAWPKHPADDSVDAGFARDMTVHHAQAVEMAGVIQERTGDQSLRLLATDMILTQQAQIGQMGAWLDLWGLKRSSISRAPMAWAKMSMSSMGGADGAMPGMASREEVNSLSTLPVPDAEIRFLQLMIDHHRGGVHMAEMALPLQPSDPVRQLARSIIAAQTSEIDVMTDMLAERGAVPTK